MSWRNGWKYLIAAVLVIAIVVAFFRSNNDDENALPLSTVIVEAREGLIQRIETRGDRLEVTRTDGSAYESRKEEGTSLVSVLTATGVDVGEIEIVVASRRGSATGPDCSLASYRS